MAATLVLSAGCAASSSDAQAGRVVGKGDVSGAAKAGGETSAGLVAAAVGATAAAIARGGCTPEMASIEGRFCIDRYEASLVEVTPTGEEYAFSPFAIVRAHHHVRAISEPDVVPQGYISATQAERACNASGKRLCRAAEWQKACRGPENKRYGYAEEREVGRCNDNGKNPVVALFGFRYDASTMNQPELNQLAGTLAKTGDRARCSNGYGVYDMVGNLHEWVADRSGTFYGGYYQDVASAGHGEGCGYKTTAHEARYHDYSTGFRCCADVVDAAAVARALPDGDGAGGVTASGARAPEGTASGAKAAGAKRLEGKRKPGKAGKGRVVAPRPSRGGGKRR
ncbi:MAG: SUMF1/EgtB/PvdO family nonheme iron enzyme [Labilithrix sp.]|nr:SUMF1/EgtB/PvdO family nonheme iron enzyme [Labilithrix sp.]